MNAPKKVLGLLGSEISYSLSPLMHNAAADALGLNYSYHLFEVSSNALPAAIEGIRALGVAGANVTIPYKERVVKYLDALSAEAREIQAVNVILNQGGTLIGYNADIYGFAEPLKAFKADLEKQAVAIIGAGGAARAAIYALKTEFNPARLVIVARNDAKAAALKEEFERRSQNLRVRALNLAHPETIEALRECKLIVNATPVGSARASGEKLFSPEKVWTRDHIAYDLVYKPLVTPFLAGAAAAGATTLSGLEMLLHQGAKSFEIWTGKPMPMDLARQVLLDALANDAKNN